MEGLGRERLPRRAFLFHKLTFILLNTKTMRLTRRSFRGYRHSYQFLLAQLAASVLGRWRIVRNLFRSLIYYFPGPAIFDGYFEKYAPDLIFSTDVKDLLDSHLIIEAKKRKIFTIGMVRSWDYLTGKGLVRVKPDKLVVHNEHLKEEAERYADMKPEDIFVSGVPHYDPYVNEKRTNRTEFFQKIGGDSKKRLIFYAPWGDKFADTDWQFLEILSGAIRDKRLPSDLQILVRLPPGDTVERLEKLRSDPVFIFDSPGVGFGERHRKANEMSYQDLLHLADSLYYSEVVVAPPSTIAIDAAVFDKPVVLMAFDGFRVKGYYQGVRHYYDFNHIRQLVASGGQQVARNREEFITVINRYLHNPALDRVGRQALVAEQCFKLDGQASERLADYLLSYLLE